MASLPTYVTLMLDGYAQQRAGALLRTDMESGPPKQLKRASRVMLTRSVRLLIQAGQLSAFITWFQTTINYGADWWTFTDPVDGTQKNARFVGALGQEKPVAAAAGAWT